MNRFNVRKVAVLGAGVMGAQIAAHLANVRVPVVLFDLPATAKDGAQAPSSSSSNSVVLKAIVGLKKLEPAPLAVPEGAALITPANYDDGLALLARCDLVIEAIAERMDWKLDLYRKVAPRSIRSAARSRSGIHSAPPARSAPPPWCTPCGATI